MSTYKDFYKSGLTQLDFKSEKIDNLLNDILKNNLKDEFKLISKYPGSYDLRPNVIDYDRAILAALKENNIKEKIRKTTLVDYALFHVQIRVVESNFSYMDWHRDTYTYDGKDYGKMPNGVKVIYYPAFGQNPKPRLDFLVGSNRVTLFDRRNDMSLLNYLPRATVQTSDDTALLFETSGMHRVVPEEKGDRSIRLIYNFLYKDQIIEDHSDDELHMRTMKLYEEL